MQVGGPSVSLHGDTFRDSPKSLQWKNFECPVPHDKVFLERRLASSKVISHRYTVFIKCKK